MFGHRSKPDDKPRSDPPCGGSSVKSNSINDIEFKIARLELGPEDILVLRFKERISKEAAEGLQKSIKPLIGDRKCMILENGADVAVLTGAHVKQLLASQENPT